MIAGSRPAVIVLLALTAAGAARSQQPAGTTSSATRPRSSTAPPTRSARARGSRPRRARAAGGKLCCVTACCDFGHGPRTRRSRSRRGTIRSRCPARVPRPSSCPTRTGSWAGDSGARSRRPAATRSKLARSFPTRSAEVADVGAALDDLLPPLPTRALAVGQQWSDGNGLELRRLADSTADGRPIQRLVMHARSRSGTASIKGDTTQLSATEVTTEDGEIDWDQERGLLRRGRHIVVETTVPAGGPAQAAAPVSFGAGRGAGTGTERVRRGGPQALS